MPFMPPAGALVGHQKVTRCHPPHDKMTNSGGDGKQTSTVAISHPHFQFARVAFRGRSDTWLLTDVNAAEGQIIFFYNPGLSETADRMVRLVMLAKMWLPVWLLMGRWHPRGWYDMISCWATPHMKPFCLPNVVYPVKAVWPSCSVLPTCCFSMLLTLYKSKKV